MDAIINFFARKKKIPKKKEIQTIVAKPKDSPNYQQNSSIIKNSTTPTSKTFFLNQTPQKTTASNPKKDSQQYSLVVNLKKPSIQRFNFPLVKDLFCGLLWQKPDNQLLGGSAMIVKIGKDSEIQRISLLRPYCFDNLIIYCEAIDQSQPLVQLIKSKQKITIISKNISKLYTLLKEWENELYDFGEDSEINLFKDKLLYYFEEYGGYFSLRFAAGQETQEYFRSFLRNKCQNTINEDLLHELLNKITLSQYKKLLNSKNLSQTSSLINKKIEEIEEQTKIKQIKLKKKQNSKKTSFKVPEIESEEEQIDEDKKRQRTTSSRKGSISLSDFIENQVGIAHDEQDQRINILDCFDEPEADIEIFYYNDRLDEEIKSKNSKSKKIGSKKPIKRRNSLYRESFAQSDFEEQCFNK